MKNTQTLKQSIYLPEPKTVDEKAHAVRKELSLEVIQAYLTAVHRGELDKVEESLKTNPQLIYAQGDLTDLSQRTFTNITGFQYAVWALDYPMWGVILKYLPQADAKAQIEAYAARGDLMQQHGLHYCFDNLLKQYDLFMENYYPKWSWDELIEHWEKNIGGGQALMPSWVVHAFTEMGKRFLRPSKWPAEAAPRWMCTVMGGGLGGGALADDRNMINNFKIKSTAQYYKLVNDLTKSTLTDADVPTVNGPGQ